MAEIKCPRCRGESHAWTGTAIGDIVNPHYYQCAVSECGITSPLFETEAEARTWWTQPFHPSPDAGEVEGSVVERAREWLKANTLLGLTVEPSADEWADKRNRLPRLCAEWMAAFAQSETAALRTALADAIRSPMGVVPDSAQGLISEQDVQAAEQRRAAKAALK